MSPTFPIEVHYYCDDHVGPYAKQALKTPGGGIEAYEAGDKACEEEGCTNTATWKVVLPQSS